MPNGEILNQVTQDIDEALDDPRASKANRAILKTLKLFIPYLKQSQEDHRKIDKMWDAYNGGKWLLGALILLNLTFVFDKLAEIISRSP